MGKPRKEHASRSDWFKAALQVLEQEGIERVTVSGLARRLGISRSGFYWHFEDRPDLLQQLCDYWVYEYTETVIRRLDFGDASPRETLETLARLVLDENLGRYDPQFADWAVRDPAIKKVWTEAVTIRLVFLARQFRRAGFSRAAADMRARIYHDTMTGPASTVTRSRRSVIRSLKGLMDILFAGAPNP